MKKFKEQLVILLVGLISASFTLFILLNTYEVFANVDIPYVSSLQKMQAQDAINSVIELTDENSLLKQFDSDVQSMGELDYMYIPSTNDRIFIGKERFNEGWLQRPNNIHYYILNYDEKGLAGDYLFYTSMNWRTIPRPDLIEVGDEIQVINKYGRGWSFVIFERKVLDYKSKIVPQSSGLRQLIIIVEDRQNQVYYSFLAR